MTSQSTLKRKSWPKMSQKKPKIISSGVKNELKSIAIQAVRSGKTLEQAALLLGSSKEKVQEWLAES